jgi:hypothetical protein
MKSLCFGQIQLNIISFRLQWIKILLLLMESERVIIHFDPVNRTRSGVPVQLLLDGTNLHALRIRVKPFYKNLHGVRLFQSVLTAFLRLRAVMWQFGPWFRPPYEACSLNYETVYRICELTKLFFLIWTVVHMGQWKKWHIIFLN